MIKLPNQTVHDMLERAVNKALAEREAQAVQREREAAAGLLQKAKRLGEIEFQIQRGVGVDIGALRNEYNAILGEVNSFLATYNDNRKG
jgi:hypothetical protein